jgi:ribosomal protein S18 acetylase RimI-like enzyme
MWVHHPTATPDDLPARLSAGGLSLVEHATGMSLNLASWRKPPDPPSGPILYREVTDEHGLRAFDALIVAYWELPLESHAYTLRMSRWSYETRVPGVRWVAYRDGQPVGKAYLSLLGSKDTAAIFGVYVSPDARGHGIARRLNELVIGRAMELGMKRVVLHSSEMAVNVYRRLGFVDRCKLSVYATAPLHSTQPL